MGQQTGDPPHLLDNPPILASAISNHRTFQFGRKQFKSDPSLWSPNTEAILYIEFRTLEEPFVFHCHTLHQWWRRR